MIPQSSRGVAGKISGSALMLFEPLIPFLAGIVKCLTPEIPRRGKDMPIRLFL